MGVVIDGRNIANSLKNAVKKEVGFLKLQGANVCLAVVLVGKNPASLVYVKNKKKCCEELGICSKEVFLKEDVSQNELMEVIEKLNKDGSVNGILVQLPLPAHLDEYEVINAINPKKDVDCFNSLNVGKLFTGSSVFEPCTPAGIVDLIKLTGIEIAGKHCVILGRSNIVGKPLAIIMLQQNATVTVCHSKTFNLKEHTKNADILVAAVGVANFVGEDMVKEGAVVIDVGINRLSNGKLCGDVNFSEVKRKASFITPVPGGVGPVTIAKLMENTLKSYKLQN